MTAPRPVAPGAVRWITRTLEEAGFETWTVGGAVRDALLDHPSGDWDLATRATPRQMRRLFRRTVPIGVEHGTVGVLARDGTMYEVTTFRRDVETDGRHAVVSFADSIDEDLARRDFTINAVAWHALREELRDPFGGVEDLEARLLRTVGEPEARFREDWLRILRALRFAGRFELRIEEGTWAAACALVGNLPRLSPERIREELLKVLAQDPRPSAALELYASSGALGVLYPELDALREGPAWSMTVGRVDRLPAGRPYLRLAGLLRDVPQEAAAALLVRLRLSNAQTDAVAHLAAAPSIPPVEASDADVRRWMSRHGADRLTPAARLDLASARAAGGTGAAEVVAAWRRARELRRGRPPLEVGDLAVGGRELIALGLKPGPRFKAILKDLLAWVLEDPSRNEADGLLARAEEIASTEAGRG
jgi:tRNA nucleotidyltransferase (CCA-adding enzyme)